MLFQRKADPYRLFLFMGAWWALASSTVFTILSIYYVQEVGMSPIQLVLVGTTLELAYFSFEVPTGVVADMVSRRLSVILAYFLLGLGIIIEGLVPVFSIILVAEVIRAIGHTFESGALHAWLADEIGSERIGTAMLRSGQISQLTGFVGIALGVGLATIDLRLPIVLAGVMLIGLGVLLAFIMPETGFTPEPREDSEPFFRSFARSIRASALVARGSAIVVMFFVVEIFLGSFSEGLDRLWEAHFLQNFAFPTFGALEPVIWFGIINAGSGVLTIILAEYVRRRVDMTNHKQMAQVLLLSNVIVFGGMLLFGLSRGFMLAVGAYWLIRLSRSVGYPLMSAWLNQSIPSKNRATVLSMVGQGNALGQIAGGPAVGWIGTVRSLRAAMVVSGFLLTPAIAMFARASVKASKEQDVELVKS